MARKSNKTKPEPGVHYDATEDDGAELHTAELDGAELDTAELDGAELDITQLDNALARLDLNKACLARATPSASASPISLAGHPHIIRRIMSYADFDVLLKFRSLCRELCAEADGLLASHVLTRNTAEFTFTTLSSRSADIKVRRIPALFGRGGVRVLFRTSPDFAGSAEGDMTDLALEPGDIFFTVLPRDAQFYKRFFGHISELNFYGASIGVGLAISEEGMRGVAAADPLGRVHLAAQRVGRLRLFPVRGEYCHASPFYSARVEHMVRLRTLSDDAWLYHAPRVDGSVETLTLDIQVDPEMYWPRDVRDTAYPPPIEYPASVKTVNVRFSAPDPSTIPWTGFKLICDKILTNFSPDVQWRFVGHERVSVGQVVTGDGVQLLVAGFAARWYLEEAPYVVRDVDPLVAATMLAQCLTFLPWGQEGAGL